MGCFMCFGSAAKEEEDEKESRKGAKGGVDFKSGSG